MAEVDPSKCIVCLLCNHFFKKNEKTWKIFNKSWTTFNGIFLREDHTKTSLSTIISNAIGCNIIEQSVHSIMLCSKCKTLTLKYKSTEQQLNKLRNEIIKAYDQMVEIHNKKPIVNTKIETEENSYDINNIENVATFINEDEIGHTTSIKEQIIEQIDPLSVTTVPNKSMQQHVKNTDDTSEEEVMNSLNGMFNESELFSASIKQTTTTTKPTKKSQINVEQKLKCEICHKILANKWSLKGHMETQHKKQENLENIDFKCEICNKIMAHKRGLDLHMKTHSDERERQFKCDICNKKFFRPFHLKRHKMTHSVAQRPFICDICNQGYFEKCKLIYHKQKHKNMEVFLFHCDLCNKALSKKSDLPRHKHLFCEVLKQQQQNNNENLTEIAVSPVVRKSKLIDCETCGKKFLTSNGLRIHVENHLTNLNLLQCDICNKTFVHIKFLKKHKSWHAGRERKVKCDICSKMYSIQYIEKHKMFHTEPIASRQKYQCDICNKQFVGKISYEKHKKLHENLSSSHNIKFKCQICDKTFCSRNYYKIHIENHSKFDHCKKNLTYSTNEENVSELAKVYQCKECDKVFTNERKFIIHIEYHKDISERKRHPCKLCDKTYLSKNDLRRHERKEHGITKHHLKNPSKEIEYNNNALKNVYKCQECDKLFAAKSTLKHHIEIHRSISESQLLPNNDFFSDVLHHNNPMTNAAHICDKCGKVFGTLQSLKHHMEIHSEVLYECDICKVNFSHKRNMIDHKNIHIRKRQPKYECGICNRKFYSRNNLKQHEPLHSTQLFKCDDCGKVYSQLRYLQKHKRQETQKRILGRNPFQCQTCLKSFASKIALNEHEGTHVNVSEYQFQCENCEKKFYTKTELKRHELKKHKNSFECDVCQKKFWKKLALEQHKAFVHMGIKEYLCDICGKSFAYAGSLQHHYAVHSNEYPIDCHICKRRFKNTGRLTTHLNVVHKIRKMSKLENVKQE